MSPSVAAIIVTHQSARFLPACLDSLAEHGRGVDLSVVVADSGSTDDVEAICRERGAAFLAGPNRGYGAAVNRALGHEAVRRARYVLVMNPDLRILDGSIADFVARCEERPECGLFAPRQVDQNGELVCSMGREPTPEDYWRALRTGWADWIWEPEVYEREARCDWVMGAFMLVRRQLLDELDGFDERFVLFSEEVDLGTRVRRAGWQIAYLPQLTIEHWWADRPLDEHRERMIMWSLLVYMRKWHGRRARASMRVALVARLARRLVRRLLSREPVRKDWVRLCAALRFRSSRYVIAA